VCCSVLQCVAVCCSVLHTYGNSMWVHVSLYLCMCVSVYVCIYVCVYLYMCVFMYVCIYVCVHCCMCVCVSACMCEFSCVHACIHVCVCHACLCICVCVYAWHSDVSWTLIHAFVVDICVTWAYIFVLQSIYICVCRTCVCHTCNHLCVIHLCMCFFVHMFVIHASNDATIRCTRIYQKKKNVSDALFTRGSRYVPAQRVCTYMHIHMYMSA